MPNYTILTIQPDNANVGITHEWLTHRMEMQSGKEQRTKIRTKKRVSVTFDFKTAFDNGALDEFIQFFDYHAGAYDPFYIPSWGIDARLLVNHTAPSRYLAVNTPTRFTTSVNSPGNIIIVGQQVDWMRWTMDVALVSSIVGNTITMSTSLSNTYQAALSYVFVGYRVRFDEDILQQQIVAGQIQISDKITFRGVL